MKVVLPIGLNLNLVCFYLSLITFMFLYKLKLSLTVVFCMSPRIKLHSLFCFTSNYSACHSILSHNVSVTLLCPTVVKSLSPSCVVLNNHVYVSVRYIYHKSFPSIRSSYGPCCY